MSHESATPDRGQEERRRLVEAMLAPDTYPHPVDTPVRHIETHISDLFLTGEHVYKLKKPVDLGFVDYHSLDRRRQLTYLELELNRRLSPEVYEAVVEVRLAPDGSFAVGEDDSSGEAHEYALRMRQLSHERSFSELLARHEVGQEEVRRIAEMLAEFHANAEAAPRDSDLGGSAAMRDIAADNLGTVREYEGIVADADEFDEVRVYTDAFLDAKGALIDDRKAQGFVRDCHGDLHTGNIFLAEHAGRDVRRSDILVIDCIEFNQAFRFIDVAYDLAFLAMDLEHSGYPELVRELVDTYVRASGDTGLPNLIDFYMVQRAMVRCKINAVRLGELEEEGEGGGEERVRVIDEARSYSRLARRIANRERPQAAYLMTGIVGSGKSTVARELARRWGMEHISSDVVRKTLAGVETGRVSAESQREQLYSQEMYDRTYSELIRRAGEALASGASPMMDATFVKRRYREWARAMAREHRVPCFIIECVLSEEETLRRLKARYESGESESDAGPGLLDWHRAQQEPVSPNECDGHLVVDTGQDIRAAMVEVMTGLWRGLLSQR